MGYDATFEGEFTVVPLHSAAERKRLMAFSKERHEDPSMPGYWCNGVPNKKGTALVWNGSEKFHRSAAWLQYLIAEFLKPAGHVGGVRFDPTLGRWRLFCDVEAL